MTKSQKSAQRVIVGWREWVQLPELGIPGIKAKVDTGAKTSAIHAFKIVPFEDGGEQYVRFCVHPVQRHKLPELNCTAKVFDRRTVTSSNGQRDLRYVIRTRLALGEKQWPVEMTLSNRDEMGFRMLLGREALQKRVMVDPGASYKLGKFDDDEFYNIQI